MASLDDFEQSLIQPASTRDQFEQSLIPEPIAPRETFDAQEPQDQEPADDGHIFSAALREAQEVQEQALYDATHFDVDKTLTQTDYKKLQGGAIEDELRKKKRKEGLAQFSEEAEFRDESAIKANYGELYQSGDLLGSQILGVLLPQTAPHPDKPAQVGGTTSGAQL